MSFAGAVAVCPGDSALDSWLGKKAMVHYGLVKTSGLCGHLSSLGNQFLEEETDYAVHSDRQQGFKSRLISSAFLSLLEFLGGWWR